MRSSRAIFGAKLAIAGLPRGSCAKENSKEREGETEGRSRRFIYSCCLMCWRSLVR